MKTPFSRIPLILFLLISVGLGAQIQNGSYKLINSITDQEITTINDGDIFYLDVVGDSLNIQAVPNSMVNLTSVTFVSDEGAGINRTEAGAPYAYQVDSAGDYWNWTPPLQAINFTITYNRSNGGPLVDTFSVTFAQTSPITGETYWSQNGNNINYTTGNVGIGTTDPGIWKLAVNGNIRAKEIKVETANWPDYVFAKTYELPSLEEVERHILEKGHLMNIPSAEEVESNGIELGEMNRLLLEKIEELTLYILGQEDKIREQDREIELLKALEKRISKLEILTK